MSNFITESLRTEEKDRCRVLVAGGGIAGIAAALAAARTEKKLGRTPDVLLLEREYNLGGLATLGLITCYLPLCDGCGHQVIYGIGEELLRLSCRDGAHEEKYPAEWLDVPDELADPEKRIKTRFRVSFNAALMMLRCERLLLSEGVRLLYGTTVCAVARDGDRITHVVCENKSGRFAVAVDSVIDATGDADVAFAAGAETKQLGQGNVAAGWYYSTHRATGERKLHVVGNSDIPDEEKAGRDDYRRFPDDQRFFGFDGDVMNALVLKSHEMTYRHWAEANAADPDFLPDLITAYPEVRMSRRIVGAAAPDSAYYGTFPEPHGEENGYAADSIGLSGHWRHRGPIYEIPFGSIRSATVRNLLAAGRTTDCTDGMWDNVRVIPTCAVTGEAAGTAAAMFSDFSALSAAELAALQDTLRADGVKIHVSELKK